MPHKELKHFEVPEQVYIYICQLENEIINRNGAVQRLYDFRFGENYGGNTPNQRVEEQKPQTLFGL